MASLAHLGAMKFSSSYLLCNDYIFLSLWLVRSIINLLSYKRKRNRLLSIRIFQLIHTKNTKKGRNTFHLKDILLFLCVCVFFSHFGGLEANSCQPQIGIYHGCLSSTFTRMKSVQLQLVTSNTPGRSSGWSAETRHSVLLENGQNRPSDSWTFSGADFMSPAPVSPYT